MSKKLTPVDLEFLEAYQDADFVNAAAVYKELHPQARSPAQSAQAIKKRGKEWLDARYSIIASKSIERQAQYIRKLEAAFYDPETKPTPLAQLGRLLLQTTGILDQDAQNVGIDSVQFNVQLSEKPEPKGGADDE